MGLRVGRPGESTASRRRRSAATRISSGSSASRPTPWNGCRCSWSRCGCSPSTWNDAGRRRRRRGVDRRPHPLHDRLFQGRRRPAAGLRHPGPGHRRCCCSGRSGGSSGPAGTAPKSPFRTAFTMARSMHDEICNQRGTRRASSAVGAGIRSSMKIDRGHRGHRPASASRLRDGDALPAAATTARPSLGGFTDQQTRAEPFPRHLPGQHPDLARDGGDLSALSRRRADRRPRASTGSRRSIGTPRAISKTYVDPTLLRSRLRTASGGPTGAAWGWLRLGRLGSLSGATPTSQTVQKFQASAEIVMRPRAKPAGDPRAFDAREVMANLGPKIQRPTKR